MLPQLLPHHPPQLHIPKYVPDYSVARSKLTASTFFGNPPQIVSSPVRSDSLLTAEDDSLVSPLSGPANYNYVNCGSASFDSPISPTEMFESNSSTDVYPNTSHSASQHSRYTTINSAGAVTDPHEVGSYPSESPSPVNLHPSASFLHTMSPEAPHGRPPYHHGVDRFEEMVSDNMSDRYTRNPASDRYTSGHAMHVHSQGSFLDHRRMSEPAILSPSNPYAAPSFDTVNRLQQPSFNAPPINTPRLSPSTYVPSLQRGASISSLRDLRQSHFTYSPPSQSRYPPWKEGESRRTQQFENYGGEDGLDGPISPLQPNFSGEIDSPTAALRYLSSNENYYGPSPPGTGTSTSSAPLMSPTTTSSFVSYNNGHGFRDSRGKTYSFVPLPGNNMKKRPRRRYDEIERLYQCSWPECAKAYGTLNHLNAHVTMQKHGPKRNPNGESLSS